MWPRRFAANIICARTYITQAEARTLVIDAARTYAVSGVGLDTDEAQDTDPPAAWTFRVFATNAPPGPGIYSNLVGWFSVDKHTAALSDPVLERPLKFRQTQIEQARLRAEHCQR